MDNSTRQRGNSPRTGNFALRSHGTMLEKAAKTQHSSQNYGTISLQKSGPPLLRDFYEAWFQWCGPKTKGFPMVSKCQHCRAMEFINHLFVSCKVAWNTWNFFTHLFHIKLDRNMTISKLMRSWAVSTKENIHITTIIPVIIEPLICVGVSKHKNAQWMSYWSARCDKESQRFHSQNRQMWFVQKQALERRFCYCKLISDWYRPKGWSSESVEMGKACTTSILIEHRWSRYNSIWESCRRRYP